MDTYEKILDAHTKETGSLKMQRSSKGEVRAIIEFTGNSARTLYFAGKNVRIYYPAINQYQDVSLGSNAGVVNQYLLLGFGSSGDQLAQSYTITVEGQEKVSGVATTKLLLVPKDKAVLEHLVKIELWIPENESNPIQQQFYEPSGNFRLITYSNIQVNPAIPGTLEFKLPKNAHKQH
jgi:outer membrane lipoprotein-sorting protein